MSSLLEGAVRFLSVTTGYGAIKRAYRGVGWAARGGLEIVQWMKDFAAGGERTWPEIPDHRETSAARFSWLAAAQGLDDADILAMRQRAKTWFTVWFLALGALVCWAMLAPRLGMLGHSFIPALDYALPWIVVFPVLAKVVQWSYWSMQLRRRELLPFQTWLHSPGEWMAAVDDKVLGAVALFLLTGTAAAAFLFPSAAMAQTAASGTQQGGNLVSQMFGALGQNELSTQWLQRLFPGAMPNSGVSAAQDVVGQIFGTLNSVFAALAAAMLGWHTVSGTVATAHEGKVLGAKWHTIWAPIRVVMGLGSLVPVKGYCMAQLLMLQIIMAGYNLADVVWNQYVGLVINPPSGAQSAFGGQAALTITPDSTTHQATLDALLAAEICYQAVAWQTFVDGNGTLITPPASQASLQTLHKGSDASGQTDFNYPDATGVGNANGTTWDYGAGCGSISIPKSSASAATAKAMAQAADPVTWQSTWSNNTAAFTAFDTARVAAFTTLVNAIRSTNFASDVVKSQLPAALSGYQSSASMPNLGSEWSTIQSAFSTYQSAISGAAGTLSPALNTTARQEFATNAQTLGWAIAGVLEPQIVRANAAVVHLASQQPTMNAGAFRDYLSADQQKTLAAAIKNTNAVRGKVALNDPNATTANIAQVTAADLASTSPDGIYQKFTHGLSNTLNSVFNSDMSKLDVSDPMSDLQTEGNAVLLAVEGWDTLLFTARAILAAGGDIGIAKLSNGVEGTLGDIFTLGGVNLPVAAMKFASYVLGDIINLWNSWSTYFMAFGAVEAIILPLMGYSMWLFALIGLITLNVEMVIGATWWAFSHVRMDGQELIDQPQRQGYILAWNAMFRPTLMLLGLIFGNSILSVSMVLINKTYVMATTAAQGDHFLNPVSWLASIGFLVYLHYHAVTRSFGLITKLPDRIARWVGAGGENLGEESDHEAMKSGTSNIIYTGAGARGRSGGGGGGGKPTERPGGDGGGGDKGGAGGGGGGTKGGGGGAASKVEPSGVTQGADKPNKTEEE